MEQKLEQIAEIRTDLMIALEKAEVLLKITGNGSFAYDLEKSDLRVISGIISEYVQTCVKLVENIELLLMEEPQCNPIPE